jgi:hypothetical protein
MLNVTSSGTYQVAVTDVNGCNGADTISVILNPIPVVSLGSDTTQCDGVVTLDAGNSGYSFLWNDSSALQTNIVSASGWYYVTVTSASNCVGSDSINVTINSSPVVVATAAMTLVCIDDSDVMISGSPVGGPWSGPGVTGNLFDPSTGPGVYVLIYSYTDTNGCSATDSVTITVDVCTAVGAITTNPGFNTFPNPTTGNIAVNLTDYAGNVSIDITDITGRIVYSDVLKNVSGNTSHLVDLSFEAQGIFIVHVSDSSHSERQQIQIIR